MGYKVQKRDETGAHRWIVFEQNGATIRIDKDRGLTADDLFGLQWAELGIGRALELVLSPVEALLDNRRKVSPES